MLDVLLAVSLIYTQQVNIDRGFHSYDTKVVVMPSMALCEVTKKNLEFRIQVQDIWCIEEEK